MQTAIPHTIDLHCHSTYSDGSFSVNELLSHVAAFGVKTLAITDHDSVGVHLELASQQHSSDEKDSVAATEYDAPDWPAQSLQIIPGVEISCAFGSREIHIVGLNIDPHATELQLFLTRQQQFRRERLLEYAHKLEQLKLDGVVNAVEGLKAEAVTRTHLGQILVELGHVPDAQRAFKRYLGRKARAYIPMQWPGIEEVVQVIRSAGGTAVIAHPARYQLSRKQLGQLLSEFASVGGQGVELAYPNIESQLNRWLAEQTKSLGLYASQGSDFHNPEWVWVKPGHFPPLPKNVQPVWELW
jgi:hypothetical protein